MSNTIIQLRHSYVTGNVPSSLANGEIAINTYDGKIFYRGGASNTIQTIERYEGPAGLDGEIQFNDSGVLGSNSGLTFNKSTGYFKAPIIESTNNGTGENFKVGDDAWIGDVNLADTLRIAGQQNVNNAYIVFGATNDNTLGRAGSGPLTYTGAFTATGILSGLELNSTQSSGDEGGQINLALAATNTTLSSSIAIDIYQNKLRFFETGGTNRGVYIDLANGASAGVGTDLLNPTATPDTVARAQANAAFITANAAFIAANSAGVYANGAFAKANTQDAINLTQNNSITAAFTAANSAGSYANSAFSKANTAGIAANTPSDVANSASSYANSAFARANNSLDANNGGTVTGTITATSFITTGSYGNILGANVIYANTFIANTGYIQFADGSKQYTANAGSGGGGTTDWGFGVIYTPNNSTYANATTANDTVRFVGESGVVVFANSVTKTITVAAQPGAQGLTVDYGFVAEPLYYSLDYGTL